MASRKHTPDGLPIYRVGEIPEHLATRTMLGRRRRRPADGQEAAAILFYHGNKHTPLYAVADSVQLPALSPGRRAAWTAARTCARCAAANVTPWQLDSDDRRLCPDCGRAERLAAARPSWLRLRAAAVTWAQEVLADPDTLLLAIYHHEWGHPMHVRAETITGEVLVDVLAMPARPAVRRVLAAGAINADEIIPHLMPLVGHRLVHTTGTRRGGYADHVTPLGQLSELSTWLWPTSEPSISDPSIREDPADAFRPRWTDWHARSWSNGDGIYRAHHGRYGLATADLPGDNATDLTARMRAGLAVMATDTHPDGPPACPWLPPAGRTSCGADAGPDGLCHAHRPDGPS